MGADLCRKCILNLTPYVPGKPIEEVKRELGLDDVVKLASNENPLGPSPLALEAMKAALDNVAQYPEGSCFELRQGRREEPRRRAATCSSSAAERTRSFTTLASRFSRTATRSSRPTPASCSIRPPPR